MGRSIKTAVTRDTFVYYHACLTQIFFYYCAITLESFSLTVLAYDRLIAICFPLRHSSINTPTRMFCILVIVWLAVFKMKNMESRYKALSTCTEHLIVVAIFYVPTITLYITELFLIHIDMQIRMGPEERRRS
ncbi:olfactory receptor 1496-like [Conger conger]|uniref:olfactory receptor 1496-like n=1 Tax=Conger conger TaxID=82655 RepID=UPI002A599D72|nr:olfactory receptor 1496-like [Conger conger]